MRLSHLLKCKLHHARVTYANPEYVGSIEICAGLMDRAGIQDGEMVSVWAVDHTTRIETYAFRGPTGVIGLNGGAAQFFQPGDRLIIACFVLSDEPVVPKMLLLDECNRVAREMTPFHVLG
jgi:aspartate 1-decarboxylase